MYIYIYNIFIIYFLRGLQDLFYTLKHENTVETVKKWFSIKCQTRKYFCSIRVAYAVALLSLLLLKFEKHFEKGC